MRGHRFLTSSLLALAIAAIAWGVLAFGAVYPWAFTPLAIVCGATGAAALLVARGGRPPLRSLAIGFAAVGIAIALQLVPLPPATLARVSPATPAFLNWYDFGYTRQLAAAQDPSSAESAARATHPSSIDPGKTAAGLMLFTALALFVLGMTRLLSITGARAIVLAVLTLGLLLTLLAMIQVALNPDPAHHRVLIYGFWKPQYVGTPFGPFVNRNHFAGWMLMAIPLVLGLFYGALERRTLELRSPDIAVIMLSGFAVLAMGVALSMTQSRSGLVSFAAGSLVATWAVVRRQKRMVAKALVAAGAIALLAGITAWAGIDTIGAKFIGDHEYSSATSRVSVWKDTLAIARDFPWTGSGLDTYGTAMILYQTGNHEARFQEAHNDYLQLAAEGGVLVGVPVLVVLVFFVLAVRRRFRQAPHEGSTYWIRVGAVVGLVSIALQSLVEFSLQMPGNAALFALLAAIALHQSPRLRSLSTSFRESAHPAHRTAHDRDHRSNP